MNNNNLPQNRKKRKNAYKVRVAALAALGLGVSFLFIYGITSIFGGGSGESTEDERYQQTGSEGQGIYGDSEDPLAVSSNRVLLDVPHIEQYPYYPTGCESVATVMALRYAGIDISVDEFIDCYLDMGEAPFLDENGVRRGCDPYEAFPGSPYLESGYGCYAPVIVRALSKFIDKERYSIDHIEGKTVEELCDEYIDRGIPVILWATNDMRPLQQGSRWQAINGDYTVTWQYPMHCLLLVGYDDNGYYFNDPAAAKARKFSRISVENAYKAMNMQSIAIY